MTTDTKQLRHLASRIEEAADELDALHDERDTLRKPCGEGLSAAAKMSKLFEAKIAELEAERDQLWAKLAAIEAYGTEEISAAVELRSKLAAMTVERDQLQARIAEVTCPECGVYIGTTDHHMDCPIGLKIEHDWPLESKWIWKNDVALTALIEGHTAVVPLICPEGEHYGELTEVLYVGASPTFYPTPLLLSTVRLDKPVEDK